MKKDIKQFKLTNGDEIICEVVEWPDEESDSIVVRNAVQLINRSGMPGDGRYYVTIKPWMVLQDEPDLFQVLYGQHVISEATPTNEMLKQYFEAISDEPVEDKVREYVDDLRQSLTEELAAALTKLYDSDGNNVISFPTKGTFH